MQNTYAWNKPFRIRVLALCVLPEWYVKFGPTVIKPEFFEAPEETAVCKAIHTFYGRWSRPPYEDELEASISKLDQPIIDTIRTVYDHATDGDLEYAANQAVQFAKEQAMKLAILASVDDIQAGNLARPLDRVREAQTVGLDITDVGLELKKDRTWAYAEVMVDKVQTGIHHLDQMLDGGLGRGELGVVMAATNVGKTMALVNIGCGAASIMSHATVVHITVELSAKKVAKRYAARTTFKWLQRDGDPDEYLLEFDRSSKLRMHGDVYIKEWPTGSASVQDIDAYLGRLELLGIKVGLLIVDYPDELLHTNVGDYRLNLGNTFRELRALAIRRDMPVWGATQATRAALSKEMVTVGDVAESFEKARISDVVIAVCQTQLEKEDDVLRLFAAKVRDGDAGWMVKCQVNRDAHAIISERVMTVTELLEERKSREDATRGL